MTRGVCRVRRVVLALAAAVALALPSCATTAGAIAGPVTGPITFYRHTSGVAPWVKVLLAPVAVGVGPVLGFVRGVEADIGWVRNGEYGVGGGPAFAEVFDPTAPEPRDALFEPVTAAK